MQHAGGSTAGHGARPSATAQARELLVAADAASVRLTRASPAATGWVTIAAAVVCAVVLALMLSAGPGGNRAVFLVVPAIVVVLGIALAFVARRHRSALPLGWDRRLGAAGAPIIVVPWVLSSLSALFDLRPDLPIWLAACAGLVLATPLAVIGLSLIRHRPQTGAPDVSVVSNPFVVLAALAAVDSCALSALRPALGMPDEDLDRILQDFEERDLLTVGWGGVRPGRRTPVRLTPSGREAHDDLRARLEHEAGGPPQHGAGGPIEHGA